MAGKVAGCRSTALHDTVSADHLGAGLVKYLIIVITLIVDTPKDDGSSTDAKVGA